MRNELKHIEQTEAFLLGLLSDQEKASFEADINGDPEFKKDVHTQQQIMNRLSMQAFKEEMRAFDASYFDQHRGWKFWLRKWGKGLGLLLLLGAATLFYFLKFGGNDKPEQAASDPVIVSPSPIIQSKSAEDTLTKITDTISNERIRLRKTKPGTAINNSAVNFWESHQTQPEKQFFDAGKDIRTNLPESGAPVFIAANSICDQQDQPVSGLVELDTREFRNQAQIAFSGLPMDYHEGTEDFRMTSSGMFEIRAYQGGESLKMCPQKQIRVNYQAYGLNDSLYLFSLNDSSQIWSKGPRLNYVNQTSGMSGAKVPWLKPNEGGIKGVINQQTQSNFVVPSGMIYENCLVLYDQYNRPLSVRSVLTNEGYIIWPVPEGTYRAELKATNFEDLTIENVQVEAGKWTQLSANMKLIPRELTRWQRFLRKLNLGKWKNFDFSEANQQLANACDSIPKNYPPPYFDWNNEFRSEPYDQTASKKYPELKNDTLNRVWYNNPGVNSLANQANINYVPYTVQTPLNLDGFGVYNCDSYYRLKNRVNIKGIWLNEMGETIRNPILLTTFDLQFNNAFKVNANFPFAMSATGRNCMVLTTSDNRHYIFREADFAKLKLKDEEEYEFHMEEVTMLLKDAPSLKTLLNLP